MRYDQQEAAVPNFSDLEVGSHHDGLDQAGRCCDQHVSRPPKARRTT
ncbi:hypothetical protein GPA10_24150 [Streptomyces sp. p1417]|uniref:Uncharacterized protein n=1 Tax=Streptomyces typhae TaxID=2681492 RepID=A0A6L6X254_9ACTN|nr:hypothetical protein [Streptomyces typhae]MVO87767.1 hypothetical protein [Streptomyces typhae]